MSSAMTAALFAIQGALLAGLGVACLLLWRRVRALGEPARPIRDEPAAAAVPPPIAVPVGPAKVRYEVGRRLDELAGRHRALEARLARVEASATDAALAIVGPASGPRGFDGPTLIAVPSLSTPTSPAPEVAEELARRYGAVWALADSGLPSDAVARETGHPVGQVELILGLRRQLVAAGVGRGAGADG